MLSTRELAAIELRFLGRTIVLVEYAFGVVLLVGFGVLGLVHTRGHSVWWWYMVGIGVNYVPLLYCAVLLMRSHRDEVEQSRHEDMARLGASSSGSWCHWLRSSVSCVLPSADSNHRHPLPRSMRANSILSQTHV
jgi:hypothetical protein